MPVLPSGRRVDFSLDRFHALLRQMEPTKAQKIVASLVEPNDLLFVLDVVQYQADTGKPFFSGHIAADFESYAIEWSHADQDALAAWIESPTATYYRAEAIDEIRGIVAEITHRQEPALAAA